MSTNDLFIRMLVDQLRGRAAKARRHGRDDLGASAVEWAIISAIVVTLALVIAAVVRGVVDSRSEQIKEGG